MCRDGEEDEEEVDVEEDNDGLFWLSLNASITKDLSRADGSLSWNLDQSVHTT